MSERFHGALSDAVRCAYAEGLEDETLEPHVLVGSGTGEGDLPRGRIGCGHAVIFYNIRGEREIELTECLTEENFKAFPVKDLKLDFSTMIQYRKGLKVRVAFPPEGVISGTLGEVLAGNGLKQARITEAEKAVHVGFFLGGKKNETVEGEERIIVPTRKDVALFDQAPEMSIGGIAEAVLKKISEPGCDFILVNFPNVDVVGHIENERAVLRAVEAVDAQTGRVVDAALKQGMTVVITADHGTVEKWRYPDGAVDTGHTDSPVPFIIVDAARGIILRDGGELSDVAPTVLELFGIRKPELMTGRSLIQGELSPPKKRRVLMLILDGWGYQAPSVTNLISQAKTPVMDRLSGSCPFTTLKASGEAVGLP